MNRVKTFLALFALLSICGLFSNAQAQARVYISSGGNDANSCTLSQPCRYLTRALNVVSAGGEVVVLDSGTYDDGVNQIVTITQSVTVLAPTGISAGFSGGSGAAITVSAGSSDVVVLRGLTLNAGSTGIQYTSGGSLHVENCLVTNFTDYGLNVTGGSKLLVKDSEIRGSAVSFTSSGVYIDPTASLNAYFDHCRIENNTLVGIYAGNYVKIVTRNCIITGGDSGLWLGPYTTNAPAQMTVDQCQVTNNNTGIRSDGVTSGNDVRVVNSAVTRNTTGFAALSPGKVVTRSDKTNTLEGNGTASSPSTIPTFTVK